MSKHKKKKSTASAVLPKKNVQHSFSFAKLFESDNFYLIIFGIVVFSITVVRWRLVGMPLERDEGEYAYFGRLILNGMVPYTEAYNMKLPGMYYMYALIMAIFGETYKGIHIGFVFMNAGTMIFLFCAMKTLFNPLVGIFTGGLYGLMAMSNTVLGFAAHATQFVMFFVSLALFFFSKYEENKKMSFALLTGIMFGMAFLMKQQAVYFILFGGIVFLIFRFLEQPVNIQLVVKHTGIFSVGVFIPYIAVLLVMLASGAFNKFWFWTVEYASKYVSGVPWESGKQLLEMTFTPIWNEHKWIYILAIAGVVIIFAFRFSIKQKILSIAFLIFGILATTPGFYFRQHYFVVALPGIALLAAITLDSFRMVFEKIKMKTFGIVLPLVILFILFNNTFSGAKWYYFPQDPVMLCKMIYGTNPFVESVEIAKYIKQNSSDSDKVAVLGSEPQIPFYAHRKSATGHIYTYGLMEIHDYNLKMQEEMISEIERAKPLYLIFVNVPFSWLSKPESPMKIFEWYNKYATEHYNIVGLVDIPDQGLSQFYWNEQAQRQPQHKNAVWIFKRKERFVS